MPIMPLFGAHLSIAGGLHYAAAAAAELGCGTVQLFTKNANQWAGKPLAEEEIGIFKKAMKAAKLNYPTAHDSYLINLATPADELYRKSITAFTEELERAEALGLSYLVSHPGAHTGSGEEAGLSRVVAALDDAHTRCAGFKVKVLIENTAGSGTCLGGKFEHLAAILDRVKDPARLGVCFDTCHAFAAGYPLAAEADYAATFQWFHVLIGLSKLKVFHVNDSVKGLGSRVDRHAAIGQGQIGIDAFRRLVTDPRFRDRPMVLETPKEDDAGNAMDPVNLAVLRGFLAAGATTPAAG
jgi:deoxyribonuclease-4